MSIFVFVRSLFIQWLRLDGVYALQRQLFTLRSSVCACLFCGTPSINKKPNLSQQSARTVCREHNEKSNL